MLSARRYRLELDAAQARRPVRRPAERSSSTPRDDLNADRLARDGEITALDGEPGRLRARSRCVRGDTPGAAELVRTVRAELEAAGVRVEAFA